MSKDLYLDPSINDLDITNSLLRLTEVQEETTRQKVSITLGTFLGEVFWSTQFGIPYIANPNNPVQLLSKNTTDKRFIDVFIRDAIVSREGVVNIIEYVSTWDRKTRIMSVSFSAITETGEIISVEDIEIEI